MNAGGLVGRMNFAAALAANRQPGVAWTSRRSRRSLRADRPDQALERGRVAAAAGRRVSAEHARDDGTPARGGRGGPVGARPRARGRARDRARRNSSGDERRSAGALFVKAAPSRSLGWARCRRSWLRGAPRPPRPAGAQDAGRHLPARRRRRPQHGRAVRRRLLLRARADHRDPAARPRARRRPSTSTGSSVSTPRARRSCRCGRSGASPSCTPAARPTRTRSHFDAQDYMETGDARREEHAGRLARTRAARPARPPAPSSFRAVAIGPRAAPRSCAGPPRRWPIAAVSDFDVGRERPAGGGR